PFIYFLWAVESLKQRIKDLSASFFVFYSGAFPFGTRIFPALRMDKTKIVAIFVVLCHCVLFTKNAGCFQTSEHRLRAVPNGPEQRIIRIKKHKRHNSYALVSEVVPTGIEPIS
ncbi:MAG: hypothetical protein K2H42_06265, partial [Alistipes sp.]|nr:hypothetical protein [Alistipes sp.]